MVRFLIRRPVAVITTFIALLLLGYAASRKTPVSPLPDIDLPEIYVRLSAKNTSAAELENTAVGPLRIQLQQLAGLNDIHSATEDGHGEITLKFKYGTDINYAFLEVNQKVDLSMNSLPRSLERPEVVKSSVSEIPVFYITMSLKDSIQHNENAFTELGEFARQIVKRRLEQLPEIAMVDLTGLHYPEIYLTPRSGGMQALGLNETSLQKIIADNNIPLGDARVRDGIFEYTLRYSASDLLSVEDIRNIQFKTGGRVMRLRDIADVGIRNKQPKGLFNYNNAPAISLAVIKQADARMDDLRKKTEETLSWFRDAYPDIRFEKTIDETALLDFSIANLKQDLLLGMGIAFVLLFIFFKNIRTPLLIGITVPVALLLSLLFFYFFHLSINIVSLSGMVLGVGLMIDNSIIVIDNITQKRLLFTNIDDACVSGTNEIIRPLLSSLLTTVSVFFPLVFLSGIAGALFYDEAMAITIGLCVSFLIAITLLPTLYRVFYAGRTGREPAPVKRENRVEDLYEHGIEWVFKHPTPVIGIILLIILSSAVAGIKIRREQLPRIRKPDLFVNIDWNSNIDIYENERRVRLLVDSCRVLLRSSEALIGEQQYLLNQDKDLSVYQCRLYLDALNPTIADSLKGRLRVIMERDYPGALFNIEPPRTIFEKLFGEAEPDLQARIQPAAGPDDLIHHKIQALAEKIHRQFPGIELNEIPFRSSKLLVPDAEKMVLYDLNMTLVAGRVQSMLNAAELGSLHTGQQFIPITFSSPPQPLDQLIRESFVTNTKGIPIPLRDLVTLKDQTSYSVIEGGRQGAYISIAMNNIKQVPAVRDSVSQWIRKEPGWQVDFTGSYFSRQRLVMEMLAVLAVSVLLLYFILAAQFESFLQPVIILAELPISLSAAVLVLYLFHASLNVMSMIGLITICGIMINDSILKIDTINQFRKIPGKSLLSAIHDAGKTRLNSIVMTSMTTILSVAPFLFGDDIGSVLQKPLSLTILGGMIIGTLVSLFFIPLIYWWYYNKKA